MEILFDGKSVFVTGAARGIGRAIAEAFTGSGAEVTAPARDELELSSEKSVNNYIKTNPGLNPDILVFNAAKNDTGLIEDLEPDNLLSTFQTNLFSSVQILRSVVPKLKEKKRGKIIFISSVYAKVTREGRIPYTSSKNAVTGLVKTLALELAPYDIMVNSVAPGYVMTDMTRKNLSPEEIQSVQKQIATGRFQTEKEIADAVMFLASDLNQSITGQWLGVEGGFLCR